MRYFKTLIHHSWQYYLKLFKSAAQSVWCETNNKMSSQIFSSLSRSFSIELSGSSARLITNSKSCNCTKYNFNHKKYVAFICFVFVYFFPQCQLHFFVSFTSKATLSIAQLFLFTIRLLSPHDWLLEDCTKKWIFIGVKD